MYNTSNGNNNFNMNKNSFNNINNNFNQIPFTNNQNPYQHSYNSNQYNYNPYPTNTYQANVLQPLDWEFDNPSSNKQQTKQASDLNDSFSDSNFLPKLKEKEKISIDKFKSSASLSSKKIENVSQNLKADLNNSFDESNFSFDKPIKNNTTLTDWDDIETTLNDTKQNLIKTTTQTIIKKNSITNEDTKKTKKNSNTSISAEINKPIRLKSVEPVEALKELKIDSLPYLKEGTPMLKYGNFGFPHFRLFRLSKDNLRIEWFSENKTLDESNVKISYIEQLVMGQNTDIFLRAPAPALEALSFSLVYAKGNRTLDIVAQSKYDYDLWVKTISELMMTYRNEGSNGLHAKKNFFITIPLPTKPESHRFVEQKYNSTSPRSRKQQEDEAFNEYLEITRRLGKYRNRMAQSQYYGSEHAATIYTLLNKVEDKVNIIRNLMDINDWESTNAETWLCTIDLDVCRDIMKCPPKYNP